MSLTDQVSALVAANTQLTAGIVFILVVLVLILLYKLYVSGFSGGGYGTYGAPHFPNKMAGPMWAYGGMNAGQGGSIDNPVTAIQAEVVSGSRPSHESMSAADAPAVAYDAAVMQHIGGGDYGMGKRAMDDQHYAALLHGGATLP